MASGRTYDEWIGRIEIIAERTEHKGLEWGIFAILVEIALILLDIRFKNNDDDTHNYLPQ